MGFKFWEFLRPRKDGRTSAKEVTVHEFFEAAQEYEIRNLCWMTCVDMIANAVGRCEIRTYRNRKEIREREYYTWNVEPNTGQNSSAFLHKLIWQLMENGEALIIDTKSRSGTEMLLVADDFSPPKIYPKKEAEYTGVRVGEVTYDKTFRERDVIHLQLPNKNLKEVINAMYRSYYRMYDAAVRAYEYGAGKHLKVHVDQMAAGDEGFQGKFNALLQEQVKPFLETSGAILPEFDGYKYEEFMTEDSKSAKDGTRDIKAMVEDIYQFTASAMHIPVVMVTGKVEAVKDANRRWLTECIDPICDQLEEEANRKRYGYEGWEAGNFLMVDTSCINHFDLFDAAANIEKLVGSGTFTINGILRAANQATINEPWADKHFMTLNFKAMDEVVNNVSE